MKALVCLALIGCGSGGSRIQHPDGMLSFEDQDLSAPTADLAGVDLALPAGADLSSAADLAQPVGDLSTLTPTTPDHCPDALLLTPPVMLTDQNTFGLTDDFHFGAAASAACQAELGSLTYAAPDAVYKVDVPSGKTLAATVLHHNLPNTWNSAIAIVADCAHPDTSCLAGRDNYTNFSSPEDASYLNATGAVQTVFVIIDSPDAMSSGVVDNGGTFDLTLTLN
jgi:hypothetical protein